MSTSSINHGGGSSRIPVSNLSSQSPVILKPIPEQQDRASIKKQVDAWTKDLRTSLDTSTPKFIKASLESRLTSSPPPTADERREVQYKLRILKSYEQHQVDKNPKLEKARNAEIEKCAKEEIRRQTLELCAAGKRTKMQALEMQIKQFTSDTTPAGRKQREKLQKRRNQLELQATRLEVRAELRGMLPAKLNTTLATNQQRAVDDDTEVEKKLKSRCDAAWRKAPHQQEPLEDTFLGKICVLITIQSKGKMKDDAAWNAEVTHLSKLSHVINQEKGKARKFSKKGRIGQAVARATEDLAIAFASKESIRKGWPARKTRIQETTSQLSQLNRGEVVTSTFPSTLKNSLSTRVESRVVMTQAIQSIPNITVDLKEKIGLSPVSKTINNYGLRLPCDSVVIAAEGNKIKVDGTEYPLEQGVSLHPIEVYDSLHYDIFPDCISAENCDASNVVSGTQYHVIAVADGASISKQAKLSAQEASSTGSREVERILQGKIQQGTGTVTLQDVGGALVEGMLKAQEQISIMESEAYGGSTTLHLSVIIGGYIVTASIGDCQAFNVHQDGTVTELNPGVRSNASGVRESCGSITYTTYMDGVEEGSFDLGNFHMSVQKLQGGDRISIVSDGVTDGLSSSIPTEMDPETQEQWSEKVSTMGRILCTKTLLEDAANGLMDQVGQNTSERKKFILTGGKVGRETGGKPDHVTAVFYEHPV